MHRTYEGTNSPVRVTWYDDRVEILSPGGAFGQVTPETFGRPGITDYRNPTLAEAMKSLGFAERFGIGLQIVRRGIGGERESASRIRCLAELRSGHGSEADVKTIAFFNNKGGVGKTTLVYHISWMTSLLGVKTVVADLDPQANVTSAFLPEEDIEELWGGDGRTIYDAFRPLIAGTGDIRLPEPVEINESLNLIPGNLSLSEVEDQLSETWPKCLSSDERAFRVTTGFSRIIQGVGTKVAADLAIIDVGPNLGAINRSALVAADFVVIPLSADLFSVQGLKNVGPKLKTWRTDWRDRVQRAPGGLGFSLPSGDMRPLGYVISRYSILAGGPVIAFKKWLDKVPATYRSSVEGEESRQPHSIDDDPYRLATLKDYRSLMPMAQEARKPMFLLKPADGAIGGHQSAVADCRKDFEALAWLLLEKMKIEVR